MNEQITPRALKSRRELGMAEFVAMSALLMAVNALGIDIMLPALPEMGATFKLASENDRQLVIITYMLGFGVAQLAFGPMTDRFGRRPILFLTLAFYAVAGAACVFADSFETLIFARILQGGAAGGVRVVTSAIVRDRYAGRLMAKVMSMVMLVFMAAPIVAPSVGQALLLVTNWRGIFWALVIFSALMFAWTWFRLPETLARENHQPLRPDVIVKNYWIVLTTREALGYIVASGFLFSALVSFVSASEQIYHEVYHTGAAFPLWFAGAAGAMSVANLVNSRLVERMGMRRLSHAALIGFVVVAAIHTLLSIQGEVPFPVFYALVIVEFFLMGFQGPNFNAIAMEPLGKLAGSGSAVGGFASSFAAAAIGGYIARGFDGSLAPIFLGHFICAGLALLAVLVTERGKLFTQGHAP
jgi:DHA1 family bicyclomycin/chloramphenicol resistance-like MFS transporter